MFEKCQINRWTLLAVFGLGLTPIAPHAAAAPPTSGSAASSATLDSGKAAATLDPLQRDASQPRETGRLGLFQKTTDLIGRKVEDRNWMSVGKVQDLVLDLANNS